MKKEVFTIVPSPLSTSNDRMTVYFSANIAERLNLEENTLYTLIFGINSLSVQIKKISETNIGNDILWITRDISKMLLIPEGITMEVIFAGEIIRIGPILALLTESKLLKDYLNGKECDEEYSLYADAAEEVKSFIYVFSLKDLDSKGKYINGYMPVKFENNKWTWQRQRLPMPDAIYNRMAVAASSPAYNKIKLIQESVPDIIIRNRITKISKWKIAELLQGDSSTKKYIPETHLLRGPEDIIKMLEKYPMIYLKPVRRSLGLGIIKMESSTEGNYTAYYNINGINLKTTGDVNWILTELSGLMGKRGYIVQQGISVALYRENLFDLRVTIQKDGTGEWSFTRWAARVAAPGNIVSNVAAGGKGVPAEKVLTDIFDDRIQSIENEVKRAGFFIAKALEKRLNDIGDLGLDIGIDMDGRIYLFEVNFRAIRPGNRNSRDTKDWFKTYHTPISHLRYLYDTEMDKKYNPQF